MSRERRESLPGGRSVSVLLRSPPADLPSWSATAAASDDDIHLRSLHKIDTTAFSVDILQSRLYGELEVDADGYADLFDAEVKRVLDIHAPLRTGRRRCGQHDSSHLSDEARQAKQQRRRLERRYRRTGLQSDKEAYLSACSTARESILK